MLESWKPVPDFPGYDVSEQGRVRSHWTFGKGTHVDPFINRILKQASRHRGRLYVTLRRDGMPPVQTTVHRLVLFAFRGPCPDGMIACHNDGNHLNNRLDNLRWDTRKSNWADRRKHGVACIGIKHGRHKLTREAVLDIRRRYARGVHPVRLAEQYGVHRSTICRIARGDNWKHVDGPRTAPGLGSKRHLNRYSTYLGEHTLRPTREA